MLAPSSQARRYRRVLPGVFAAGMASWAAVTWVAGQAPSAPPAFRSEDPPYRGLDANLYMRSAAEYRACCFQAFNLAAERLKAAVAAAHSTDRLAVILDLDETILDNSGFQAAQTRSNLAFDQRLWELWELHEGERVGLVPGAKEFVTAAVSLGVTPIYISSRDRTYHEQTKQVLARLQLPLSDDRWLMLADATTGSDKTSRRTAAEKEFSVVLLIGDNLRDFDEAFRFSSTLVAAGKRNEAIDARAVAVDRRRAEFGDRFIILPNPAYGEWNKVLGHGLADLDLLAPAKP
jgi:5'-nucleotidase (lipoprotein e(P4) family)